MYGNNNNYGNRGNTNNNNQDNNNQQIFKKSGAVYSKISKGNFVGLTCVNAWKSSKMGMITCSVMPYHASNEIVENSNGTNVYIKMIARIEFPGGVERVFPVLMNEKTKVIAISELSLCITPNGSGTTRNGKRATGYFGTTNKN
jgi:hypothetical protein